nr:hypothetical protein [uncultured Roseateles sp.]
MITPIAILAVGLALCVGLFGIHSSVRDVCLQLKKLREALPTYTPED